MESLFWIESAGFNQHYSAAYPSAIDEVHPKIVKKSQGKSYYRFFDELPNIPATSKKGYEDSDDSISSIQPKFESLPVSIPNCDLLLAGGKQTIKFHINMGGLRITTRTYSEFETLQSCLVSGFLNVSRFLAQLPQSYVYFSSVCEIEKFRQELERYLFEICRIKVIAESDLVQDFLSPAQKSDSGMECEGDYIKLSERVNLRLPVGFYDSDVDTRRENRLDVMEQLMDFADAQSPRSFVAL